MDSRWLDEDLYWSKFKKLQFCVILSGNYDQLLPIPKKFTNNVKELGGTLTLQGPSGDEWEVGLVTKGDTSILQKGWKEFSKDHCLKENDILIFKYNGLPRFEVSMFDGNSLCEKGYSYFVKNSAHIEVESGRKRKTSTISINDDTNQSSYESSDYSVRELLVKTPRNDAEKTPTPSTLTTLLHAKLPRGNKGGNQGSSSGKYKNRFLLTSHRRAVTEGEKDEALAKAKKAQRAASLQNSFIIVMRPTHVYKGFYLTINAHWSKENLPPNTREIVLRMKEREWPSKYEPLGSGSMGRLINGWKDFVLENFLEEFDVCLFTKASGVDGDIILDVSIFRVVEVVKPPSPVRLMTQGRGRGRGRGRPPKNRENIMNEDNEE